MNRDDYWAEAVASSLEEAGVDATSQQIAAIAGDMEISRDQESMAFGDDVADTNLRAARKQELDDLRRELCEERAKVVCPECHGKGYLIEHGPCHSSESQCYKCRGDGRVRL